MPRIRALLALLVVAFALSTVACADATGPRHAPRVAPPVQGEKPPEIGGGLPGARFSTPPPPAGDPDVTPPIRGAVHQLDQSVADRFLGAAAAEHLCQRSLRPSRVAETEE